MRIEMDLNWEVSQAPDDKIEIANDLIEELASDLAQELRSRLAAAGVKDIRMSARTS